MLELEEALARILSQVPPAVAERIGLSDADGRVLSEPAVSAMDLPPFDNSAMDGYAVRSADVISAKPESPVRLRLAGKVAAGETFSGEVKAGTCVRLFTGSPLPHGADAVVMQEDTRIEPGASQDVLVLDAAKSGEHVRFQGEDVKRGSRLAEAGDILTIGRISLLAANGFSNVSAGRRPVVGVVATGSELREPGQSLGPGQIYESNRVGLSAMIRRAGGMPKVWALVPDSLARTRLALAEAFNQCDAVVTSGGASVGEMDFIKEALTQESGTVQFWKVAIKPGRPFAFGQQEKKLFFGLPGNPVSALVTFLLLVRPALLRWQGAKEVGPETHPGTLGENLANPGERRHFMRVKVDEAGTVYSAGAQASHMLSSMASANGLVDVAPRTTLAMGASVQVLRWE
ncbi:MAG: molybdopterin molybdotransferase [Verrucomicrobiota bacterium]